jgi:hypothetical protein
MLPAGAYTSTAKAPLGEGYVAWHAGKPIPYVLLITLTPLLDLRWNNLDRMPKNEGVGGGVLSDSSCVCAFLIVPLNVASL